ncbi:MAG: C40 family peptidase [Clostridia bacterium]|nr:C40 family peptidase [Clostridia bacterium]
MKRSYRIAAAALGFLLLIGCSSRAEIVDSAPDTEKIQIVGQIETAAPAAAPEGPADARGTDEAALTPEPVTVTEAPTEIPTAAPTEAPTPEPTEAPTPEPTDPPAEASTAQTEGIVEPNRPKAELLCEVAQSLLNKDYHRGGKKPETGFDPGGFVYYCLNAVGVKVRHKTSKGYSENDSWERVDSIGDLEPGDLCFFMTPGNESVNCVAVYLGNDEIIYPSSGEGKVIVNKITSNYWKEAFVFARRVF